MSRNSHTPGPWKVNTIGKHWNNQSLTHIEVTFGMDGECVCDTVYEMADAHLIAAAPELLKELEETHAALCFTPDYIGSERYERNKSAIAKAVGQ